jgi:hypothetical protein
MATNLCLAGMEPPLNIKCGPLVRYIWTDYDIEEGPIAFYSILLVTSTDSTQDSSIPMLEIAGINTEENAPATKLQPGILLQERGHTFWRWKIPIRLIAQERRLAYRINHSKENLGFWVPAADQSMRIMFYSCNGT